MKYICLGHDLNKKYNCYYNLYFNNAYNRAFYNDYTINFYYKVFYNLEFTFNSRKFISNIPGNIMVKTRSLGAPTLLLGAPTLLFEYKSVYYLCG